MKSLTLKLAALIVTAVALIKCENKQQQFSKVSAWKSNVDFENTLVETIDLNIFTYDYIYNGGGVALGDINNDGLVDLYFSGNTVKNKLYLNKGDFSFEDISSAADVEGKDGWKTGVTMTDINGDGWLDIYVCYSGLKNDDRSNQLFINNGTDSGSTPSFTERAKEYGLDASGTYSTQASFFDYDLDGDLDMFLVNHGIDYHSSFANAFQNKNARHLEYGNRLYRNDNGFFSDVSSASGILGGWLNYGLSASISDFNNDNYPDVYVSNDFDERDFLYLNNGDGTFKESLKDCFGHISKFTMGTDAADFNNDNLPDMITLDMLPEDNYRQKLLKGPDGFEKYNYFVGRGFHNQQMRNMLQLNRGLDEKGVPVFSEIGQLAGVAMTDWSWSSLFADFDNDGFKDIFISNGYLRDFTNLDFQKYDFENARQQLELEGKNLQTKGGKEFLFQFVNKMPSIKVSNYVFRNTGALQFENKTVDWGLNELNLTNGAAYADLDNDGDLDIVTNNLNEKAGIFRNNSERLNKKHFLNIKLSKDGNNTFGIGAKVYIMAGDSKQFLEAHVTRGYLSSVDNMLHFGLGDNAKVDEVKVVWPDGKISLRNNVDADVTLTINHTEAVAIVEKEITKNTKLLFSSLEKGLDFIHQENTFLDYRNERLLLYQLSRQGPRSSAGDVNRDGLEDIFIGGASGQSGKLFLQTLNGSFAASLSQPWEQDKESEDVASIFFDCDNDHDLDLYIVSGGNELPLESEMYQDRLYLNDGKGNFKKVLNAIPNRIGGGSCVSSADFDNDGDVDLFVGGWSVPSSYPKSTFSRILRNESTPNAVLFNDVTVQLCSDLQNAGVLHDANWNDYDGDGKIDLAVVGDWMPIKFFKNVGPTFKEVTQEVGLNETNGFWNRLESGDFDNDGDTDFIAGNMGLNSELKASHEEPVEMYCDDFDKDGRIDPVIFMYNGDLRYPLATRDELLSQISFLKKKYIRYSTYANASINDVLDSTALKNAWHLKISELKTSYIENLGNGKFKLKALPLEAQVAPVHSIVKGDFNNDKIEDILIAGNFQSYRAEYGPFDASIGLLLVGDGKGNFAPVHQSKSGIMLRGDVRDITTVTDRNGKQIFVVSKNNDAVQVIELNK